MEIGIMAIKGAKFVDKEDYVHISRYHHQFQWFEMKNTHETYINP